MRCTASALQLIEALQKNIVTPSPERRPVSVVRGSRVIKISSLQARSDISIASPAAEVICEDGSRYAADLVICAIHPYDLAAILGKCTNSETEQPSVPKGGRERGTFNSGSQVCGGSGCSSASRMASLLLALPCASWVTVHVLGKNSSRRADSLGRGCFYSPQQLNQIKERELQSRRPSFPRRLLDEAPAAGSQEALAALNEAIKAAEDAVQISELQLPGNLFPHSHAAALSASGLFDGAAAPWVTAPVMLHAQATVRVHKIEFLMDHMQQLLLPLQRLLHPGNASRNASNDERAAGLRALGLLIGVAEDVVSRMLIREGIITTSERVVLCSRLLLQAEPQWPLTLQPTQHADAVIRRQNLASLLEQFERLRQGQWNFSPALHAACSDIPTEEEVTPPCLLPVNRQITQDVEESPPPMSFVDARLLFHQLRVHDMPWLQVVGPSGSFG